MLYRALTLLLIFLPIFSYAEEPIVPLSVGNHWVYQVKGKEVKRISKVVGTEIINGHTYYKYQEIDEDSIFRVRNTSEGQEEYDDFDKKVDIVLKYPVSQEEIYKHFTVTTKVTPNVKVLVPAGLFRAYKYEFHYDSNRANEKSTSWYSPGVGLVKHISDEEVVELIEFNIK